MTTGMACRLFFPGRKYELSDRRIGRWADGLVPPSGYRGDVRVQLSDRFDAVAVVEPIPPRRVWDWVLAGLLALAAIGFVVVDDSLPLWAQTVPAAIAVGFVPFRRRIPLTAVATVSIAAAASVAIALRDTESLDVGSPAGLADVVLFYALCRWSTPLRVAAGFVLSVGSETIIQWSAGRLQSEDWILVFPWLVVAGFALAMRYRARLIEGRHEQVRLAERNSLARELHDTVAHHVSAIAVQAQAGQYVVESDPAAAAKALESIAAIANDSIDEMRRMVGILRSDDHDTRNVAPATLDVLAAPDGRPAVHVSGDTRLDELPAGVGAALFRIAQESITNARRHSRDVTFIDVAVERHADRVDMTVDNDGAPTTRHSGSGYGQVGMRERAEALGGSFESSARSSLGWRTRTSVPLARVGR
jgi:signal transduction histidine kinase